VPSSPADGTHELGRALAAPEAELAKEWTSHDLLVGQERAFFHDGQVYRGRVQAINEEFGD